jgi:hypothetical protein
LGVLANELGFVEKCISSPVAPASNNASACTNPNPRAAPLTNTTLSWRLNSGSLFLVPRYVGAFSLEVESAAFSAFGGGDGSRAVAERRGRKVENERVRGWIGFGVVFVRMRRRGMRRLGCMVMMRVGVEGDERIEG